MPVAFWRAASLVTLVLVPVLVTACGSDKGAGFLLGAFSIPGVIEPAGRARVRVSTPGSGVVIGGISSAEIGRQMSTRERGIAADAEYRALEYGRSGAAVAWTYPAMRHRGSIVPGRPYKKGDQYCRNYTHTINRGGSTEIVKGVACRKENGTWRGSS
jgi:surface antigen